MRRIFVCTICSAGLACGSNAVGAEEAGSTTAVEGSDTDGNTTGETGEDLVEQLCAGSTIPISLTGSTVPQSCDSFEFTGSLFEQLDSNHWVLDSCGCDEDCDAPDPHELTITLDSELIEIPPIPACPSISVFRNEACFTTAVIVRDLALQSPTWWALSWSGIPFAGFEGLETQITDTVICSDGDDDGGVTYGHRMQVAFDGESAEIDPGDVVVLGGYELRNAGAYSSSEAEIDEWDLNFFMIEQ